MRTFLQDVRFAFRQFATHTGFALTAVLSLALGVGATVAVFSIVYAVLMNPWPYPGADRICTTYFLDKAGNPDNWGGLTGSQIRQLRQAHTLEDVMGVNEWNLTVTGGDVPEDVVGIYLTPNGFQFLGLTTMLGRYFLPSDAPDGQEPQQVVVLSHKFWQRHFNGDPSVVGKSIQLVHKTYTILGVMPPRFTWEDGDVYLPLNISGSPSATYGWYLKLKPGKRYYPGGDVIGHSLKVPTLKDEAPYTLAATGSDGPLQIVGVVADALDDGLDKPVKPAIFLPYSLYMWMHTQILVESRGDPQAILHSIRRLIVSVDADQQAFGRSDDLETWIRREPEMARGRLVSILFGAFSVLALVLAAVGLYSVVSYSVVQRTNEFGIRMALGARKKDVLWNVLASAGVSVGSGLLAGLAISLGLNRVISRWVENGTHDPWLILGVSAVLLAVAGLACLLPSWRASSVDPMTALRCE